MSMETWVRGWVKKCKRCGGRVRFVENLGEVPHCEWLFECLDGCGYIPEEDVEFIYEGDDEE